MSRPEETIPPQEKGIEVNVEEAVPCADEAAAQRFYAEVKDRLLNVNGWDKIAGALSATFYLTDSEGLKTAAAPRPGYYFRIDIPAPGIVTGEGFDWVRIEEIKEEENDAEAFLAMRVRPASSPLNTDKDVAHFYDEEATSTFIVRRNGNTVTAGVYGRNEKPNVKSDTIIDKIRNAIVGSGAVSGFAKLQWKALVSGLLSPLKPRKP